MSPSPQCEQRQIYFFCIFKISVFRRGWVLRQILYAIFVKYASISSLNLKLKEEYCINGLMNLLFVVKYLVLVGTRQEL